MINHQANNLTIAIAGHRFIPTDDRLRQSIRSVLEDLINAYADHTFSLLCPLAEGSDQLAAQIALDLKAFELHVPLPLPVEEYLQDFSSEKSQISFQYLLSTAVKVTQIPFKNNHQEAYRALGQYLIQNSDVLLSIWNGVFNQKVGGTGDVVRMAVAAGKTVYWIYCPNQKPGESNLLEGQKQIGDLKILSPPITKINT